ncbi:MAG: efflux RND transporter periplasmic adaptor subunit [Acidiferrobacter sp.]
MKRLLWGLAALSGVACAHPLVVRVVSATPTTFRPTVTVFGRVHGPNKTVVQAPYDALMGPLLVAPGTRVSAGAIIVRLLPASLAGTVRALEARAHAALAAYQQGQVLARQGLITPVRAHALKAAWQADVATLLADTARLARGVVRAPFAGTVRYRAAPGAWLTRGTNVAEIAGRGTLYETAALTLHEARRVFIGARVAVAGGLKTDAGRVYAIATRVDTLGLVRAYVHGLKTPLRPGQVVKLVLFGHRVKSFVLPRQALIVLQATPWIYIVKAGHAQPVAVVIQHLSAHRAFITAALPRAAQVIDSEVSRLRAGTIVQVAR